MRGGNERNDADAKREAGASARGGVWEVLSLPERCVPSDHARQSTAYAMAKAFFHERARDGKALVIVDLGCGDGNSVDFFRREVPGCQWIGVDIEGSPEVRSRRRDDAEFRTFDGVHIPLAGGEADLVFCNQAITHADRPVELLADVRRILKPGGELIGSMSYMEPIVTCSRTNFTPYGFHCELESAGLELHELRPGIDSITLILRRLLWKPWIFDRFYETESPLNRAIDWAGRWRKRSAREINARKLLFAGQYVFRSGVKVSIELAE